MSEETKKNVQEVKKFLQDTSEKARRYQQSVPDKQLGERLRKVQQGAEEGAKYITERTEK